MERHMVYISHISFCDTQIVGTFPQPDEDFLRKRDIFLEYMKKTLLKKRDLFHERGLAMKEFKLSMNCFDLEYMARDTDLWLKLAMESGVEFLQLCLPGDFEQYLDIFDPWYDLPPDFLEAKSLNKLELLGGIRVNKAFLNPSIKFLSLRVLSLWSVLLGDEEAIKHIISHCPLIEQITMKLCYVYNPLWVGRHLPLAVPRTTLLKSLTLKGLQKLKGVDIQGIQDAYIDAPNLETLWYCPDVDNSDAFKLNIANCKNLRQLSVLSLNGTDIDDTWFIDLFSKFPFLESLKMNNSPFSERINITSDQLKVLELSSSSKLKEINIDAPKLLSCQYCGHGDDNPAISFLSHSSQLKFIAVIDIDYSKLCNLREFIQNFKPLNVFAALSLFIHSFRVEPNLKVLPVLSPLPYINHLHLQAAPKDESLLMLTVNNLLSSFCPGTISLCLNSYFCSRAFIKFLYETLSGRGQDVCYCSSGDTKCWWHGLKNVKVTSSVKTDTDENIDFETMLAALPPFAPRDNISFRLEF